MTGPAVTDPSGGEVVVRLAAPAGSLVGIITPPAPPGAGPGTPTATGPAAVLCAGGWFGTATNRNRVFVQLARRLAAAGVTALRFDWHGVGESDGSIERYVLDEPFADDVTAAVDHLSSRGFDDITLVGVCFGARSAFAAADLPAVRRLILLSFPVPKPETLTKAHFYGRRHGTRGLLRLATDRSVLAGLADANTRRVYRKAALLKLRAVRGRLRPGTSAVSRRRHQTSLTPEELLRSLTSLSSRGVTTHLLFGEDDAELLAFEEFVDAPLQRLLSSADGRVDVQVVPGNIHGFDSLAVQDHVADQVVALMATPPAVSGAP